MVRNRRFFYKREKTVHLNKNMIILDILKTKKDYIVHFIDETMCKKVHFVQYLTFIVFLTVLLDPITSNAQLKVAGGGGVSSGISIGTGNNTSIIKRNPSMFWLGSMWTDIDNPSIIYSIDLMGEIESRVSVGLEGRVELLKQLSVNESLSLYFLGSAFVSPFTLFGLGGGLRFTRDYGTIMFYIRSSVTSYLGGSDLPKESMLVKFDIVGGIMLPLLEVGQ